MKISSFEPGCFDTVRIALPLVELKSLTLQHHDAMDSVRRAFGLCKYDSASEALYLQGAALKKPDCKVPGYTPTATELRRMAAWDDLSDRLKEQRLFVTSERGQERACRDLARQDAATPIRDVIQVAARAVKCERSRVEAYCDEFEFLADEVIKLCKKTAPTQWTDLLARMRRVKRLLQQCDTSLQAEDDLVRSLHAQAQNVLHTLQRAKRDGCATVEIAHAFSEPRRRMVLTAQEAVPMRALYRGYGDELGDLHLKVLPLARRAIREALDCIERSTPGPGVPCVATSRPLCAPLRT